MDASRKSRIHPWRGRLARVREGRVGFACATCALIALVVGGASAPARADAIQEFVESLNEMTQEVHRDRMQNDPSYRHKVNGDSLLREERFAEAASQYTEAVRHADGNDRVNLIRALQGYCLVRSNQPREGLAALDRSIADSIGMGDVPWVQRAKGMAHGMLGDLDSAISAFSASIEKEPTAMAYAGRGMAHYQQNRPDLALQDYREALRLRPGDAQIEAGVTFLAEVAASAKYLADMARRKGAQRSASGLVFIPLDPGSGRRPAATDTVRVHYHGTLRDGTVFDSSKDRGAPFTARLDKLIPCWIEGVQKMRVGGRSKMGCPARLAYGDRGAPPRIPAGAALVFEMELLAIE